MRIRMMAMLLALSLLLPAAGAFAQEMEITLTGTLELSVGKMGVDLAALSAPDAAVIEPVWDDRGVLQLKDEGYARVVCLGCELQLSGGLWRFPAAVDVHSGYFTDGYGVSVYFGEGDQEWYYEDGALMYCEIPTNDGGRVIYAPASDAMEVAYVTGNRIITARFELDGSLDYYYLETFSEDQVATVRYTADGEPAEFSVTDRATGAKYAFGGSDGWFVQGSSGYEACAAPEDFEDYSVEMIVEDYPPIQYGPEALLGRKKFSLSGSTVGSMDCTLGDRLTFTSGVAVNQLTFRFSALTAPLVSDACLILSDRSFVELLVIDADPSLFNPAWIAADETSGVRQVQLPSGETVSYEQFLAMLK